VASSSHSSRVIRGDAALALDTPTFTSASVPTRAPTIHRPARAPDESGDRGVGSIIIVNLLSRALVCPEVTAVRASAGGESTEDWDRNSRTHTRARAYDRGSGPAWVRTSSSQCISSAACN